MTSRYFLLLFFIACFAPSLVSQEISEDDMIKGAKQTTHVLQNAIERVIDYGKKGYNADELINDGILPNFIPNAKIQTANVNLDGTYKVNDAIPYEIYFKNLWRKAKDTPSLKISFSDDKDLKVIRIDKYRYKVVIRFVQVYESNRYKDETTKDVIIQYFPENGAFEAKIGSTYVVDAKRI